MRTVGRRRVREMPSVYVYPLSAEQTGAHLYDNLTAGDHDYHFRAELELTQRFRAMPQADPATADMLVVPFMCARRLVQRYGHSAYGWLRPGAGSSKHSPSYARVDRRRHTRRCYLGMTRWWRRCAVSARSGTRGARTTPSSPKDALGRRMSVMV